MNKIKLIFKSIMILLLTIFIIYITPLFLNFMERQTNILQLPISSVSIEPTNTIDYSINTIEENTVEETTQVKIAQKEEEKTEQEENKITTRGTTDKERTETTKSSNSSSGSTTKKTTTKTTTTTKNSSSNSSGWIAVEATAYCPCISCCGKTNGITASGKKAQANHTIAAPSTYKFGTQIEIKGYGTYVVEDRGGAINGNRIDIFFNTHQEALNWGRRTVYIKVL